MADEWFAALCQSSYRRLVLMAYAMTNDLGAAEEITQEAFALAYGRRARVASADSPEAWIRAVVINLVRRRLRRRGMLDRIMRRRPAEPEPAEPASKQLDPRHPIRALDDVRAKLDPPALGKVIERSRQHGTRRRMRLAATIAVLAVAAAIPVLRTALAPVDGSGSPQATGARPVESPVEPTQRLIDFADARHGFATRIACTAPPAFTCTTKLLVTSDGGENWLTRDIPNEVIQDRNEQVRMVVLGPRTVTVGPSRLPNGGKHFYTADAGLSWTPVPETGSATVPQIPAGGALDAACSTPAGCDTVPVAIAPDSGRVLPLATKPPLAGPTPVSPFALAGGWWITGFDPATGTLGLAVSRDAGRNWSVKSPPNLSHNLDNITISARGTTLYAVASGALPDGFQSLVAIYRSTNGGNTWELTFTGGNGKEPHIIGGNPIAAADGQLIVTSPSGPALASRDGGRNFYQLPAGSITGSIVRTRGGYLASAYPRLSNVYKYSTDGVSWKEIIVP